MSLFGESPPKSSPAQSKSLFGEQPAAAASTSSLFADDDTNNDSPWSMPTPKKQARQSMVKNLLPSTDVPESYVDAFDSMLKANETTGAGVSLNGVKNIIKGSNIDEDNQDQILNFVIPGGQESANGVGRNEFNVLFALIGLAQEGEEVTLDSVDERRRRELWPDRGCSSSQMTGLPQPKIPYLDQLYSSQKSQPIPTQDRPSPSKPRKNRQDSFGGDPTTDPWASPANKNIPPPSVAAHTIQPNGLSPENITSNGMARTTSTFTTQASSGSPGNSPPTNRNTAPTENAWSNHNGAGSGGFSEQNTLGGGFEESEDGQSGRTGHQPQRSVSTVQVPPGTGESVTITLLPEKEGMFMFQHHNYEVKTVRKGSSVVRRYSDFVWLLDCLQKRYPFRRLPLLPPKRVQRKSSKAISW